MSAAGRIRSRRFWTTHEVALQLRLNAADQRVDVLEKALRTSRDVLWAIKDSLGLMDGFAASTAMGMADAALKPAEGCEHSYHYFGTEQPRRRCNLCNKLELADGGGDEK